jgi:hypothetical protein
LVASALHALSSWFGTLEGVQVVYVGDDSAAVLCCAVLCCAVCAGTPLHHDYTNENVELVTAGCCNLARHIANAKAYGVPVVRARGVTPTSLTIVNDGRLHWPGTCCGLS